MDFEQIKELVTLINSSDLTFFELSDEKNHIKMDKSLNRNTSESNTLNNNVKGNVESESFEKKSEKQTISEEITKAVKEKKKEEIKEEDSNVSIITSPMVGTFYSASSPDSEPFVKAGDTVTKGKIICIIEAMKLMNEIESEYSGEIIECLAKDGDMVEYGQPLFKIKEV